MLKPIYLDAYYWGLCDRPCHYFDRTDEIPYGCDMIGLVFYSWDTDHITHTIHSLLDRCDRMAVVINEPVGDLERLLDLVPDPRVQFFADAVLMRPDARLHTAISWFVNTENYYATRTWARDLIEDLSQGHPRSHRVDCLLGHQRTHRDIIDQLYKGSRCRDSIIFTYYRRDLRDGIWDYPLEDHFCSAASVDFRGDRPRASAILPVSVYNQSYYSVVAETTIPHNQSQFTEKVAKPMIARRPFVAFAGPGYLRNLRGLGFQTFGTVIDESYDDILDLESRMRAAWHQVEALCDLDPRSVLHSLAAQLDHNQRHFLRTDWQASIKRYLA